MTQPRFRSRTYRRVHKKLPGGKVVLRHEKRMPGVPKCAVCKTELKGIPKARNYKMKTLGLSKKRSERAYGGNLCSKCARNKIKTEARKAE